MKDNSTIKMYINVSKAYYHPGEKFQATILLDVLDTTNCNKMEIVAKGKGIVKAIQKTYIDSYADSELEEDYSSESDDNSRNKKGKFYDRDDTSSGEKRNDETSIARELNESFKIFNCKKSFTISSNDYLVKGKYSIPFEVELPENIPGSFFYMDNNTYVEVIYTVKVKLNKIKIKEAIPIIIRQKKETFKYVSENQYTKKIMGCCFDNNESTITLGLKQKYMLSNETIKLNVLLNNSNCDIKATPVIIELYQKLTIFPKSKNKRLKITKIVGKYRGKRSLHPRENLNLNISFDKDIEDYDYKKLGKTKAIKYFRHKDIIPLLNQSVISDFVICEYEAYGEIQFPNWTVEELGVFLPIIIYPPEKGIISKTVSQKSLEFSNSIVQKKVFLSDQTKDNDPEFRHKNKRKNYKNNTYYDNSDSEEENKKFGKRVSLVKVKSFGFKNQNNKEDDIESNEKKINDDPKDNVNDNINNNIYINNKYVNNKNGNNLNEENNNIMNENGSFGTYEKQKKNMVYVDTNSNNIKKEFSQTYLNDALDDEFLDNASFQ